MNETQDVNTKDALLAAAIEVFADKGYDSATVRDICGKAKANVAAVNYHYGNKDGLYGAVLEEIFPTDKDWRITTPSTEKPEARLRQFLRGLAGEIFERGDAQVAQRWAIFLREMAKPSHNLDFIVEHQVRPRSDELRSIIREILGPEAPPSTLAFASANVWALMLDHLLILPILQRLENYQPDMEEHVDEFVNHVVRFSLGGLQAIKDSL